MGNNIGGRRTCCSSERDVETGNTNVRGRRKAEVMNIHGKSFKLKTPVLAGDVVNDYPGHVLLESKAVKLLGLRAKPLPPLQELKPNKIYFLVELPKLPAQQVQRLRSGIQISAKDRLDRLMLLRRSASDLSNARPPNTRLLLDGPGPSNSGVPVRLKIRLPKAEVAKLVQESKDETEMGGKVMDLYMEKFGRRKDKVVLQGGELQQGA